MAFPVIETVSSDQESTTNTTNYPVTLPSGIVEGNLLLVWVGANVGAERNFPDPSGGWVKLGRVFSNTTYESYVYAKIAAGSDTLTINKNGTNASLSYIAYRISGAYGTLDSTGIAISGPEAQYDHPNPPSLNPGGWNVEDTLWVAGSMAAALGTATYPTNYDLGQRRTFDNGSSHVLQMCGRQLAAASEDPPQHNLGSGGYSQTFTLAVRPAGASNVPLGVITPSFIGFNPGFGR